MMGFGAMGNGGGGNSSSSTSNLSALAPPFTVDRLNPKPSANPRLHYSESAYVGEPFSHPWKYAPPSAPTPEVSIDSSEISSVPLSDGYRFSASASNSSSTVKWPVINSGTQAMGSGFGYGGEVKPYYSSYVAPLFGEEDEGSHYNVVPSSGLSVGSQHDYTQSLFDEEYGPRWVDGLGFEDGKRAKRSEFGGSFSSEKANVGGSHNYINKLYQGGHNSENWNKSKEDSCVFYQSLNLVSERESHAGSSITAHMEDNSCFEQNLGFIPYNSNRTCVTTPSSPYLEPYPSAISCDMQKNFPHYQNSCSTYEKCVRHVDTPFPGRASVIRASPAVVIRPPPATYSNSGQGTASRKLACSDNVGGVHSVGLDYENASKLKDSSSLQSSSKFTYESLGTNLFDFSKQGNGFVSPASVKELSSPLHSKDSSDRKIKARFGSQLPDINVPRGFSVAGDDVPVVNSTADSSDTVDHHNTAVDSPCWKGAPSQFSPFDVEAGNSSHAKVNLDKRYGFGGEEHKNLHSDSEKVDGNMGKENICASNGVSLALERTLSAICSTKEHSLFDGAKDAVWTSLMTRKKKVELVDSPNMLNKEPNPLNNSTSVFGIKVSDSKHLTGEYGMGMTVNDVSEGAAVAVHAAEKVLASPASQEDATEHAMVPDPNLKVSTMIKAIHNLSELLRFHLSSNTVSLEDDNIETLQQVISNLDSFLSKKVILETGKQESNNDSVGDTSEILGESYNVGKISGGPHMKSEAANSDIKFNYLHMHDEERNYSFPGKKVVKSPDFSLLRDDLDVTGNDAMTKVIKTVLDENFQLNEEMLSQALLFKNLWLEAEAKLCSISYKARFDRMKIQIEEIKRKPPKENKGIAEMTSQVCVSPDPIIIADPSPNPRDITSTEPTLQKNSISSTSGLAEDYVEASVLTRFNILKSRDDNLKQISMEEEPQPEIIDDDAGAVMSRFNILKSREEYPKSIGMDEEKQLKITDGDAGSVMDRFNILKSREENSKSISMGEEKQPKMIVDPEFAGKNYLQTRIRGQLNDETLILDQKPHQTGNLRDREFDSNGDVAGYEPLNDYHLSVMNDQIIRPFKNSMMSDGDNSGSRDSSSSDWEHVLKDDFSWKNLSTLD